MTDPFLSVLDMQKRAANAFIFLLLPAVCGHVAAEPSQTQWRRSPYAPAYAPSFPRLPEVEEIARPPNESIPQDSARRPRVESLFERLSETRDELRTRLGHLPGSTLPEPHLNGASRRQVEEIETLLSRSESQRLEQTANLNKMIDQLEIKLVLDKMAHQEADSQSNVGADPTQGGDERSPADRPHTQQKSLDYSTQDPVGGSPADMTGEAVDRLRLADSLFGQQRYLLSRDIYLQLRDLPQHAGERVWIEFQIASCYRNLGDIPNAERFYRLVVGSKQGGHFADYARWWLSASEKSEAVRKLLEQVNQTVTVERQPTDGND